MTVALNIPEYNPAGVYKAELINAEDYSKTVNLLREFFLSRGYIEAPTQTRLSILAACEDPTTVATYEYNNMVWPLPQTGQVWLEYELLNNPSAKGYFCISTSYRDEKDLVPGRHRTIFPMFEFESHGGIDELKKLEKELCVFLGLGKDVNDVKEFTYDSLAERYGVKELDHDHEERLCKEETIASLITDFPNYTSPFWNMKQRGDGTHSNKVDVIIDGMETIGSAERSCNVEEMRTMFHEIMDGGYADLLYRIFGKERVEKELEDYFKFEFFPRSGGGIGVTRMMSALKKVGKI